MTGPERHGYGIEFVLEDQGGETIISLLPQLMCHEGVDDLIILEEGTILTSNYLEVVLAVFLYFVILPYSIQLVSGGNYPTQCEFLLLLRELQEVDGVIDGEVLGEEQGSHALPMEADVEVPRHLLDEEVPIELAPLPRVLIQLNHVLHEQDGLGSRL